MGAIGECRCSEAPNPEQLKTYGVEVFAEQCVLCHNLYRAKCPKCAKWTRDLVLHTKKEHAVAK